MGNGSFGVVFQVSWNCLLKLIQATVSETSETVAIKKVYQDKRYKNRELQIMKELFHPNVVLLRHAFYTQGDKVSQRSVACANTQITLERRNLLECCDGLCPWDCLQSSEALQQNEAASAKSSRETLCLLVFQSISIHPLYGYLPQRHQTIKSTDRPCYSYPQGLWFWFSKKTWQRSSECILHLLSILQSSWAHFWCNWLQSGNWCVVCWLCNCRAIGGSTSFPRWIRCWSACWNH